ncbi:MAG TPA: hypothetical protein VKA46_20790 [Gemmataceae bacterium]|nr:hypothetical protein [Gemmataceae bacterium]
MKRKVIAGLVLGGSMMGSIAWALLTSLPPAPAAATTPNPEEIEPDIRLARGMGREPTQQELALLQGVAGRSRQEVLRLLGHPAWVYHSTSKDKTDEQAIREGLEAWEYAWKGRHVVYFHNGVATGPGSFDHPGVAIAQVPCD